MWVSTVLGLRNSSAANFRVGLAVNYEPRDLLFAFCQYLDANAFGGAGPRASVDVMAEASQFTLCRGAVSERAAGVRLGSGVLQFGCRALGLTGLGERPTCERTGEGRLDRGADLIRSECGGERALGGGLETAAVERNRRGGTLGHGICHAEVQRRGRGLGRVSGVFGVDAAAEREPTAGQQLERLGSPHARDQGKIVAAR
jgi:hypothetical protein